MVQKVSMGRKYVSTEEKKKKDKIIYLKAAQQQQSHQWDKYLLPNVFNFTRNSNPANQVHFKHIYKALSHTEDKGPSRTALMFLLLNCPLLYKE